MVALPNRLIKDSIYESDKVNTLSDFQFRVWVSLITYVDDFGRGDARPAIIKGRCFPLRRQVSEEDVLFALRDIEKVGCIQLYTVGGKPFLCFPRWAKHQTIRNQRSKYPGPEEADLDNPPQNDATCEQLKSTASNPEQNLAGDDAADWKQFVREYSQNIGLLPTSTVERGDLEMFMDEYGLEALREIIHYTARKHADNPHLYFSSVCRNWLGKGIRTAEQVKSAFMDYERRKGGTERGVNRGDAGGAEYRALTGETVV